MKFGEDNCVIKRVEKGKLINSDTPLKINNLKIKLRIECAWHAVVLRCSCAWRLASLHAHVLVFWRACVLMCLACLLVLCPYVVTCLTCFDIVCPIFCTFEKLTPKNPYTKKISFDS